LISVLSFRFGAIDGFLPHLSFIFIPDFPLRAAVAEAEPPRSACLLPLFSLPWPLRVAVGEEKAPFKPP